MPVAADFKPMMMVGYETLISKSMQHLHDFQSQGGYKRFEDVLKNWQPDDVINEVKSGQLARARRRRISRRRQVGVHAKRTQTGYTALSLRERR